MSIADLVHDLEAAGVSFALDGGEVVVDGPEDALVDEIVELLRAERHAIRKFLRARATPPTAADVVPADQDAAVVQGFALATNGELALALAEHVVFPDSAQVDLADVDAIMGKLRFTGVALTDYDDGALHVQCPEGWLSEDRRMWLSKRAGAIASALRRRRGEYHGD